MKNNKKLFMILIYGPMGSGKTTVAKLLSKKLKRTAHIGLDRIKSFISDFKRNNHDNEISTNIIFSMVNEYLNSGINVLLEQKMSIEHIKKIEKIAQKNKAELFVFKLNADKKILDQRVKERSIELGKSFPKNHIQRNYKLFIENNYKEVIEIDTSFISPELVTKKIIKEIKK